MFSLLSAGVLMGHCQNPVLCIFTFRFFKTCWLHVTAQWGKTSITDKEIDSGGLSDLPNSPSFVLAELAMEPRAHGFGPELDSTVGVTHIWF